MGLLTRQTVSQKVYRNAKKQAIDNPLLATVAIYFAAKTIEIAYHGTEVALEAGWEWSKYSAIKAKELYKEASEEIAKRIGKDDL